MNDVKPMPAALLAQPALICFSHLRWDFVLQRPQHLMARFARQYRVFFWEEAIPTDHHLPYLEFHAFQDTSIQSIRPRLPARWSPQDQARALSDLLDQMIGLTGISRPVLWFYTPMMWSIARHVEAGAVVYDCMDELSAFRFAPPELAEAETELLAAADVVFTGGHSIWEAKAHRHRNIHPFPSSVDMAHFSAARAPEIEAPADQAGLPHPRLGYYGVIDERLDLGLIATLAAAHPDWSIVMLGPLAKISEHDLPRAPNIHWLGQKSYAELPRYLAGWNVALMPFAMNEATRFISPTKTPEYLAGGVPVVSTPVRDVVRHYGDLAAVHIAEGPQGFVSACEAALAQASEPGPWRDGADALLAELSWDRTFQQMGAHLDKAIRARLAPAVPVRVPVEDRRDHPGGKTHDRRDDCRDAAGLLIHPHGLHVFHTNSGAVCGWLDRFAEWQPCEQCGLARVRDMTLAVAIRRSTLSRLYGLALRTDAEAAALLARLGVVDFPAQDGPYTGFTEYEHLAGQADPGNAISDEYPSDRGDPLYPIPRPGQQAILRRYQALASAEPGIVFVGRLGNCRCCNLDQVVAQALAIHRKLSQRRSVPAVGS